MWILKETKQNEQKQQPEEKYRELKIFKDDTETTIHRNAFKSTKGTYLRFFPSVVVLWTWSAKTIRRNFFTGSIVKPWHKLSRAVVKSPALEAFRRHADVVIS